jgi:hypothetical protein
MDEKILEEVLRKLNILLDENNGMKISAMGILANNTAKTNELLDKCQKFIYFGEARQQKILKVLCKIAGMSPEEINELERQK